MPELAEVSYHATRSFCLCETYLYLLFQDTGYASAERLPVTSLLGETSLMFLVHSTITPEQMASYVQVVRPVFKRARR